MTGSGRGSGKKEALAAAFFDDGERPGQLKTKGPGCGVFLMAGGLSFYCLSKQGSNDADQENAVEDPRTADA